MIVSELLARLGWQVDNRGLNNFRNNLNNLANQTNSIVSKIKSQFAGLWVAIAGAFSFSGIKNLAKEMSSLEDLFLRLKALTKTTNEEFKSLRSSVLESAKLTSFTTEEVIRGAISLATGGLNAEQIKKAILPLTQFSEATGKVMAMSDYAELVANIMNAWEMKNEEFFKATDIMTAAVNNATLDVKDFAYSMRYVAGISADMGKVSLEETAALISTISTISKGTMSGTALAQLVGRLAAPSKGMLEQFQKVGVNPFTQEGLLRPLKELIPEISRQMQKNMSRRDIADFFRKEFGQPALAEVLYLFSRPQKFLDMVKVVETSKGTTGATASASISPLTKMFSAIEVSTTELKSAILQRLEPTILFLGSMISRLADTLSEIIKNRSSSFGLGLGTTSFLVSILGTVLGINLPNILKTIMLSGTLFFGKVTQALATSSLLIFSKSFKVLGKIFRNSVIDDLAPELNIIKNIFNTKIIGNFQSSIEKLFSTISLFVPTFSALLSMMLSFFLIWEDFQVFLQGGDSFIGIALDFNDFKDTILTLIGTLENGLDELKTLWIGILSELGIYTNGEWKDILLKTFTGIYISLLALANITMSIANIFLRALYAIIKTIKVIAPYIKDFIAWIASKLGEWSITIPQTIDRIIDNIILLKNTIVELWNKLKDFASFLDGQFSFTFQWLKDIFSGKEKLGIGVDTKQLAMAGISAGTNKNIVQNNNITVNANSSQPNDIAKSIKNNIPREFIF